jgi:hypothetical protein
MPSFKGEWTNEVYRFVQKQDEVRFECYTYPSKGSSRSSSHWKGSGVVQQGVISAYYLNTDTSSYESGTFILKVAHQCLKGRFFQHDERDEKNPLYISEYDYVLYRVQLPTLARLRMLFQRPPFSTNIWPKTALDRAVSAVDALY